MSEPSDGKNENDDDSISLTSETTAANDKRRALLQTVSNSNQASDFLVLLEAPCCEGQVQIRIQYVPDRWILPSTILQPYLAALPQGQCDQLEKLALTILEDVINELVPRWVQIVASEEVPQQGAHRILVEDRQPNWGNQALLAGVRQL